MTSEQDEAAAGRPVDGVIAALRANPMDFAGSIPELRIAFDRLGRRPDPAVDACSEYEIGGVPVLEIPGREDGGAIVFAHAGGYVAGSAMGSYGLTAALAAATGRRIVSVDYRLAPEHPFPAARDDLIAVFDGLIGAGEDAGQTSLVGASAGGGIVLQALLELRDRGAGSRLPGAAALISPFSDLTLAGTSYAFNAERDPSLTRAGLAAASRSYAASGAAAERPSAELLRGLPPLQIHVGSLEILLSDSVDLAAGAAAADVHVELEVWPGMVHVFPTFSHILPEGIEALLRIEDFLCRRLRMLA